MALQSLSTFEGNLTGTRRSRLDLTGKAYKQPAVYAADWLSQPCNDALLKPIEQLSGHTRLRLTCRQHDLTSSPTLRRRSLAARPSRPTVQPLYPDAAGMRFA